MSGHNASCSNSKLYVLPLESAQWVLCCVIAGIPFSKGLIKALMTIQDKHYLALGITVFGTVLDFPVTGNINYFCNIINYH